jgi:peptide deformylase
MAVLPIRLYGDPVLREKSWPVAAITPAVRALAQDMIDTMTSANGIGLAAPQVGELVRLFVVDLNTTGSEAILDRTGSLEEVHPPQIVLINPEIVKQEGEQTGDEGCLSFPDLYDKVTRPNVVRVAALDLEGEPFEIEGSGILARALVHEVDHLDGVLFIDRLSKFRLRFIQGRLRKLKRTTEEALKEGTEA